MSEDTGDQEIPAVEHRQAMQLDSAQDANSAGVFGHSHRPDDVALTSLVLGAILSSSLILAFYIPYHQLPLYVASLAIFHFLEYWITAKYNSDKVNIDSFLIRNGSLYIFAHASALLESVLEWYIFGLAQGWYSYISQFGLILMILGQTLRSMAMVHASSNFSHQIVGRKSKSHSLVTNGVYSISRHPSYLGYFWWAIGTQIFLLNPIACIGFTVILWRFFRNRIQYEERLLTLFFDEQYIDYKRKTPILIPFIDLRK
ncbi:Isoprenylcysteine carboxyl methyltransferase family-domain-containing protein [Dipodascopsis uninucleata]